MADFRPSFRTVEGSVDVSSEASSVIVVGQQTLVGVNTLTTVATMTANGYDHVTKISCSGEESAKWQLFVNSVLVDTKRGGLNISFEFSNPLYLTATNVLDVKVTHYYTGATPTFDATIYGFSA